jgi:hypothetical protein
MGRPRAIVIPLLATLVLVGPIGLRSAAAQTKTARGTVVTGKVQSVAAGSLTIAGNGKEWTFSVDPSTKVLYKGAGKKTAAAGGRAPITDLVSTGDTVSVSYRGTGDSLQATSVRVTVKAS